MSRTRGLWSYLLQRASVVAIGAGKSVSGEDGSPHGSRKLKAWHSSSPVKALHGPKMAVEAEAMVFAKQALLSHKTIQRMGMREEPLPCSGMPASKQSCSFILCQFIVAHQNTDPQVWGMEWLTEWAAI
ncbi:hypothetical protein U0070_014821 [Myodes glareolus]|uniref:Uncharacterized protein n=1 Tax=Myodes glareolus TaxID=447135 RepID=A0AAW0JE03_MYOGA